MGVGDFIEAIKLIDRESREREQGLAIMYGEVTVASPLQIKIDDRFYVEEDSLILTSNVIEKTVDLTHSHTYAEGSVDDSLVTPITIIEALSVSEKVMLLRVESGQRFIILDRIG